MLESSEAILEMEARPDPYVGKVLAGRYKIIRVIGAGGMGAVYEAEHSLIGRRVAVKILYAQLAGDAAVVKRFVNEARAAATIGHPHILECTDIGQADDGSPFLVLELLEGHDLEAEFQDNGPMPIGRLMFLLLQACDALAAAHNKGIIHRDIKPENIYLSVQNGKKDHVKVLDFGISKFNSLQQTGPGTMTGSAMGTPFYMSPEQFRDASNVDARADIYAMGVILYQGLAGRLPFMADSLPGLALEIATGTPLPLETIRPDVPEALVALVNKTMSRLADDRVQTMTELRAALEPFVGIDAPVDARVVDASVVAAARATAADPASANRSQIRVKTDESEQKKATARAGAPTLAIGIALALAVGGAGIYATTPREPAPVPGTTEAPAAVAAVAVTPGLTPAPQAAPEPAAIEGFAVSISANTPQASVKIRGESHPLPYTGELASSPTPEILEVTAPGRTTMRYALRIDRPVTLFATLVHGRGERIASDVELAVALTGPPANVAADRPASSPGTHASSPTSASQAATPPSATPSAEPRRQPSSVYRGPRGDLPDL